MTSTTNLQLVNIKAIDPLLKEGDWYLVDSDQVGQKDYKGKSFIVHDCSMRTQKMKEVTGYLFRRNPSWLAQPCLECGEVAPESLRGLFYIHNFDVMDELKK